MSDPTEAADPAAAAPQPAAAPPLPAEASAGAAPDLAADAASPTPSAEAAPAPSAEVAEDAPLAAHVITVRVADYKSDRTFADFPIAPSVLQGLTEMGYVHATPVQAATIDPALAGRDLIVRAKTGTGKTCAFCVPMIERVAQTDKRPKGIVLAPTRELALQVAQECAAIAKYKEVRTCVIYGGVGFGPQEQALRDGVEIVVGTPGRILDHVRRGNLDLSGIEIAVLDEADEMLSMGFLEDVRKILDRTPRERQTLLFSATLGEGIKSIVHRYLRDPEEILLSYDGDNVSSVKHILYETSPDYHKARALLDLIEQERPTSALIFCNTREDVSTVCTYLERQGLGVEMISGELPQNKREKVMARVKAGLTQFLVATDVAARGIDISDLSHVINYALPDDASVYLHRIGRTGRIGKTGTALTLAGGGDFSSRLSLERIHKIEFEVKHLPTPEESTQLRADRIGRMLAGAAGSSAFEAWLDVARSLKGRPDADTLIAVALRGFLQWDAHRRRELTEQDEAPPSDGERRDRGDRGDRRDRDRGDRRDRRDGDRREARDGDRRDGERREGDRREARDGDRRDRPERRDGERREGDRPERRDGERREGDRVEPARDGATAERRDGERRGGERRERRDGDRRERRDGDRRDGDRRERREGEARPRAEGEAEGPGLVPVPPPPGDEAPPSSVEPGGEESEDTEETEAAGAGEAGRKRRRRRRRRRSGAGGAEGGAEGGGEGGGDAAAASGGGGESAGEPG